MMATHRDRGRRRALLLCLAALVGLGLPRAAPAASGDSPLKAGTALLRASLPAQEPTEELAAARRLLEEGRPREVIAALLPLRERYAQSAAFHLLLGEAYLGADDPHRAAASHVEGLALEPDNADLLVGLGKAQRQMGKLEAAADMLHRASQQRPDDPLPYSLLAPVLIDLERYDLAIDVLEKFLALEPDNASALHLLAYSQALVKDHEGAIASYEKTLVLEPDDSVAHYGLGVVLVDHQEMHDRALEHLRRALELDDRNADAYYQIARILGSRGDLEGEVEALEECIRRDPESAQAHYRLAQTYARSGDQQASRDAMQRFTELQQQAEAREMRKRQIDILTSDINTTLADTEVPAGRRAEIAEELLEELLTLAPEDPDAWNLATMVHMAGDDHVAAQSAVNETLKRDPSDWRGLFLRGLLHYRAGDLPAAHSDLERSLESNPTAPGTYSLLGNVEMARKAVGEAVGYYRRAIALAPDSASLYLNIAAAYRQLGLVDESERAMAEFRRLIATQR